MAFNPLQSYLSGQQAGQMQQAQDISGRLAQSDQPMLEPEFQRLLELDPARAKQIMDVSAGGDALRSNAQLKDAKTVKYLLGIKDYEGVNSLLGDRTAQLGGRTAVDTDAVKGLMANQDYAGAMNAVDSYINLFDPNASKSNKQFAPETSAPKVDPTTGQIFYTVFDKNTREANRVDIPGAMAQTPGEIQSGVVSVDTQKQLAKQAIEASTKAFEQLPQIKKSIGNIDSAINAINSGANTGKIAQYLPSITEASLNLDNIAGQMGLDVISSVTFGALSESELKFAVDTALPRGLEGPALKDWLGRKKTSQQKLARELQKMAIFLGKGGEGRTVADYLSQDSVNYSQSSQNEVGTLSDEDLFN
jgi:hypothetical protein